MGDRLTLRRSSVWPTVSLVVGGCAIFAIGFLALHSTIRSYVAPPKVAAPRPVQMALAGVTSGVGSTSTVVQTIRITPDSAAAASAPPAAAPSPIAVPSTAREARPAPRGSWDMAAPPTWLATVDAAAGLGVPAEVDPSAPVADTIARPKAVGLAAMTALVLPHALAQAPTKVAQLEDVPLPRARPKPPAPAKVTRKRGRR